MKPLTRPPRMPEKTWNQITHLHKRLRNQSAAAYKKMRKTNGTDFERAYYRGIAIARLLVANNLNDIFRQL